MKESKQIIINIDEKRDDFNFQDYTNDETPTYKTQSNNFSKGQDEHQNPYLLGTHFPKGLKSKLI